jgi:hypothetical protein
MPRVFPILRGIADWVHNPTDELCFPPNEVRHLSAELKAVRDWMAWEKDWDPARIAYFEAPGSTQAPDFPALAHTLRLRAERLREKLAEEELAETVEHGMWMCEQSIDSGNPMEFCW